MGRRSNKRSRVKSDEGVNERAKIAKLIDSQASRKRPNSDSDKAISDSLRKQYDSMLTKFNLASSEPVGEDKSLTKASQKLESKDKGEVTVADELLEDQETKRESKRKLRKMAKPSLAQLKKSAVYPQVVEWYDCDAPYPSLLVKIKSSKNVVPVAAHWQMKRQYLSGRSLLEKRPFELPDIIKQTDIEVMRKTIPVGENGQEDPSLKQISRARVQPKLGSLDIDYRKLHDIFFKLGARWKPDVLLPFGDQYYENRNLFEEAQWKKYESQKRPGRISSRLRQAMGIPEGQLPPWCSKMKGLGMPPSYPGLKVAGLNWGIENMTGEIYGTLESPATTGKVPPLFGTIISVGDEQSIEEITHGDDIPSQKEPTKQTVESVGSIEVDDKRSQPMQTTGPSPVLKGVVQKEGSGSPRALYTVLKERTPEEFITGQDSKSTYVIPGANEKDTTKSKNIQKEREERVNDVSFKF